MVNPDHLAKAVYGISSISVCWQKPDSMGLQVRQGDYQKLIRDHLGYRVVEEINAHIVVQKC